MFIQIKTNEATDILIAIPTDDAATSAQSILDMFEGNAVFFKQSWSETTEVKPEGIIHLGNEFTFSGGNNAKEKYIVTDSTKVPKDFQRFDTSLFVNYRAAIGELESKLREKEVTIKELNAIIEKQKESIIKLANSTEEE